MPRVLGANKVPSATLSTIDPVRSLLAHAGIDVSAKTDADRRLLSDVGSALELHSMWRSARTLDAARRCLSPFASGSRAALVQVREHVVVDNMQTLAREDGGEIVVHRLRIRRAIRLDGRPGDATTGVASDDALRAETDMSRYDSVVDNDYGLDDLAAEAARSMIQLGVVKPLW